MSTRSSLCLAAAALLAACESTQDPAVWTDLRLPTTQVWSGGEVQLVSAEFTGSTLPTATLGGSALVVSRVDDSTVTAQLPDGNGVRDLHVELAGFVAVDTQITLHGFRSGEVGPFLSGFVQSLTPNPWVLGAGDSGLVEIDVRANAVLRQWPDTVHSPDCTWGVGPSVRPGHYVFFGKTGNACTHPWVWQYGSTLSRVDSVFGQQDTWAFAEIGPGGVIGGADDLLHISRCDSTGCAPQLYHNMGGALTGVTIGRVAQRAVLHSWFGWLVDAAIGDTLRRISWLAGAPFRHIEGVAFNAAEDTLYTVGSQSGNGSGLFVVAPATGAMIDSLTLGSVQAYDLARDASRPVLYVFGLAGTDLSNLVPLLILLDQGTLTPIATLRAPASEALSYYIWHQFRLVPDPAMNAMYVVATYQSYDAHGVRARILRFDLVP